MVLDINNKVLAFVFSLMNETLKQTSAVDRGFKPLSVQTKDYNFFCFCAKHAALRLVDSEHARNHDIVSDWGEKSISGLLFQRATL